MSLQTKQILNCLVELRRNGTKITVNGQHNREINIGRKTSAGVRLEIRLYSTNESNLLHKI